MTSIIKPLHIVFISSVIVPPLIAIIALRVGVYGCFYSLPIFMWLFIPCSDKNFGNRGKFYFIRQTIFLIGGIMVIGVSLLMP